MRRRRARRLTTATAALASAITLAALSAPVANAVPAAPKPTSTAKSPSAPDPHPPVGGLAPDGSVPGGAALASRGLVLPKGSPPLPTNIGAHAWILADLDSGQILAARDAHGRYQPASIFKTLMSVTVLPNLPGSKIVTVSKTAAEAEGSAIGLLRGGRYTVDQLFEALMLVSANDAAAALSEANGGTVKTVADMNRKAQQLGAYDTFAQTPSGLDGWQQLTSAYDMAEILQAFVRQPRLVAYDRLAQGGIPAKTSPYGKVGNYLFANQNAQFMAAVAGGFVGKSGFTDAARHTYLAAAKRDGRTIGLILLRDERRPVDVYVQAASMFNWAFSLKSTVPPVGELQGAIGGAVPSGGGSAAPVQSSTKAQQSAAPAKLQAQAQVTGPGSAAPITAAVGGFLVIVAGLAGWQVIRRRARRQH